MRHQLIKTFWNDLKNIERHTDAYLVIAHNHHRKGSVDVSDPDHFVARELGLLLDKLDVSWAKPDEHNLQEWMFDAVLSFHSQAWKLISDKEAMKCPDYLSMSEKMLDTASRIQTSLLRTARDFYDVHGELVPTGISLSDARFSLFAFLDLVGHIHETPQLSPLRDRAFDNTRDNLREIERFGSFFRVELIGFGSTQRLWDHRKLSPSLTKFWDHRKLSPSLTKFWRTVAMSLAKGPSMR